MMCFDMNGNKCLGEGSDELAGFCAAGQAVDEWTRVDNEVVSHFL